jgi:hypothetical protein
MAFSLQLLVFPFGVGFHYEPGIFWAGDATSEGLYPARLAGVIALTALIAVGTAILLARAQRATHGPRLSGPLPTVFAASVAGWSILEFAAHAGWSTPVNLQEQRLPITVACASLATLMALSAPATQRATGRLWTRGLLGIGDLGGALVLGGTLVAALVSLPWAEATYEEGPHIPWMWWVSASQVLVSLGSVGFHGAFVFAIDVVHRFASPRHAMYGRPMSAAAFWLVVLGIGHLGTAAALVNSLPESGFDLQQPWLAVACAVIGIYAYRPVYPLMGQGAAHA